MSGSALRTVGRVTVEGKEATHTGTISVQKLLGNPLMEVHQGSLGVLLDEVLDICRASRLSHILIGDKEGVDESSRVGVTLRSNVGAGCGQTLTAIDDVGHITGATSDDTELLVRTTKAAPLNVSIRDDLLHHGRPSLKQVLISRGEFLKRIVQDFSGNGHEVSLLMRAIRENRLPYAALKGTVDG